MDNGDIVCSDFHLLDYSKFGTDGLYKRSQAV